MSTLQSTTPQIISTDDAARTAMTPSAYVTSETLRAGDPAEREATHLVSADEKFVVSAEGDVTAGRLVVGTAIHRVHRVLSG